MEKLPNIYLGSDIGLSPLIMLKAGKLNCLYQGGAIRHITGGDNREILRMIYPAVRDHNWGTVPGIISGEEIEEGEDFFSVRYECRYTSVDIDYQTSVYIQGKRDNTLIFSMKGRALSTFKKNRIGLNILHPIRECAGRECQVLTPEGEAYQAVFPRLVSPHQPMKNIRFLSWSIEGKIRASLKFSGDVFEMEDQRNWTDASYKTYCTPLELPFPVRLERGETMAQQICLSVELPAITPGHRNPNRVIVPDPEILTDFPALGLCRSTDIQKLFQKDLELIGNCGFDHYRIDLHLYHEGWKDVLREGLEEAAGMGLKAELGLFFGEDFSGQLENFLAELSKYECRLARFLVFTREHINDDVLSAAVFPVLKEVFGSSEAGTGTNANFAELNRQRPDTGLPDFLTWSVNPQIHAFDPLSLIENLSGQADTVVSARAFPGEKPVIVSPVTLKPRFNAVALTPEEEEATGDDFPDRFDPRQTSLFCAGWTLGSIKYLAESGAGSITYYETAGRGGIIPGQDPPWTRESFPVDNGDFYPVYFLFRELLKLKEYRVRKSESSFPLQFSSLLLEGKNEQILILANHTPSRQRILFPEGKKMRNVWVLDEDTIQMLRLGKDPVQTSAPLSAVSLNPYAVTFLRTI